MSVSSYRFIDPRTLLAISDLHLLAKTVVDGFLFGVHQSPQIGAGLEFSQYRSYEPGDDLRRVDWKMYARSDRYFVRESEIESSIAVHFVIDASRSMAHDDSGLFKFDYARFLVASLAYLAHGQGDAIGLLALNDQQPINVLPKAGQSHLHRFLHELERLAPEGKWPGWQAAERLFSATPRRHIIVVVSDLHEADDEIRTVLAKLTALKIEVLFFHLLGKNERNFSYQGLLTFEDLESGETRQVDAKQIRAGYLEKLDSQIASMRKALHNQHIAYNLLTTDQPLDFALRAFLQQRQRRLA